MMVKLVSHMFLVVIEDALGIGRSSSVYMGRWSAKRGRIEGWTSHITSGSAGLLLCQTLLGHVQLEVAV